jgi:hypothetical protein
LRDLVATQASNVPSAARLETDILGLEPRTAMAQERAELDPASAQNIGLVCLRRFRDHEEALFMRVRAAPVVLEKV